jgi:hypothetical protein
MNRFHQQPYQDQSPLFPPHQHNQYQGYSQSPYDERYPVAVYQMDYIINKRIIDVELESTSKSSS